MDFKVSQSLIPMILELNSAILRLSIIEINDLSRAWWRMRIIYVHQQKARNQKAAGLQSYVELAIGSVHFADLQGFHAAGLGVADHEQVGTCGDGRAVDRLRHAAVHSDAGTGQDGAAALNIGKRQLEVQSLCRCDAHIQQVSHGIGVDGECSGIVQAFLGAHSNGAALLKTLGDDEAAGSEALDHGLADGLGDLHAGACDGRGAAAGDHFALNRLGAEQAREQGYEKYYDVCFHVLEIESTIHR
jgi:hypothetical protein